jgi:hypothetical protein
MCHVATEGGASGLGVSDQQRSGTGQGERSVSSRENGKHRVPNRGRGRVESELIFCFYFLGEGRGWEAG